MVEWELPGKGRSLMVPVMTPEGPAEDNKGTKPSGIEMGEIDH